MIDSKLKEKYLSLYTEKEFDKNNILDIENTLNVILPNDLKKIAEYCNRFDNIGNMDLFSFDRLVDGWNIIEKTEFFRTSINLPHEYIVLQEGNESFIVLETQVSENNQAPVIWCGITDAYNLASRNPLIDNPRIFATFADFFTYLLDEEETERAKILGESK
jgi:hypothetical protein